MRRHGYTLVEVLAVTVLLGLLAGLGVPPMVRAIAGDPLARAAGRLAQAFRDARTQGHGRPIAFALESWGFDAGGGAVRLPEAVLAAWSRDGRPLRRLELDHRGHALDSEVVLRLDARELRFAIDGLTGRWMPRTER